MRVADATDLQLDPTGKRVIIAGGGYAGITLAATLANRMRGADGIEIVLIDPRPFQQALSELDLVAAGTSRPQFAELWHASIFRNLPITVCYDRLEAIRPAEHRIDIGPREHPTACIPYWRLVVATGAVAWVPPVPGLADHALTMWSVDDAFALQKRIERQFRRAASLTDARERERALSFTVVGGGATGVEIIGTIAAVLPTMIHRSGYDPKELKLRLVEGRPDILYDLPASQRARARARLERMGVEIICGEKIARVEGGCAYVESGRCVEAETLVWCGGAHADPDAVDWGLQFDNSGRLVVELDLKVTGHDAIYACGDVAAFRDPADQHILPMLAQFAIREAEQAADNILAEARNKAAAPFVPNMHGEFVSIGPRWGVGWMFGLNVSGRPAIFMKRLTYVLYWLQVGSFRLAWSRTRQMVAMHR
jgi:NADH:ubiquinone reductase (H+-translocating)